ncbi:MAG: ABC transporter ATP-binding protein [Coriobacteriales bacterium]|nr:ABC transporter ATP-binding protein [Coriobacteriales bacterium]
MAHWVSLRSLAKEDRPTSTWAVAGRMLKYLRDWTGQVTIGIVWLVVASIANAAFPALTGWIIDVATKQAASGGSARALVLPALAIIAVGFVAILGQREQILRLGTAGQHALYALRNDVFGKLQELPVGYYESVESGDLMSRLINDIEQINSFLSQGFRRVLGSTLALVATLVAMLWINWVLALATLLVVPVMLGVSRLFGMVARRAFRKRQESIGDVSQTLAEELAGIKVAQAFNRTAANRMQFADRNAANRDANVSAAAVSSAFSPVLAIISTAATAMIAALGGYLAAEGTITIGVVVAFFGFARAFFNGVSQLSSLYAETQAALAGAERVFQLLDLPVTIVDSSTAEDLGRIEGRVTFDDVYFRYQSGPEVLHGIDLDVEPGSTLAIVGPTGAGKTTLINLVARFYDPTDGTVSVDGRELRDVTLHSLRSRLGIVLQEPFLFAGTIADNIRYGRLDATESDVRSAAETARALDFIDALPQGFATDVGERGATLSTGQRQLIAFARAILADPAILILDEATSSVDTRTERLIQDGLHAILEGRTALIIAHRLSTVRDADRIVVVEGGLIVEDGTYSELLAARGAFARLHEAQFGE